MDVTIRRLVQSDFAQLKVIDRASFPEPWTSNQWKKANSILFCHVLMKDKIIVGYIVTNECGEIIRLAVDPLKRRQGFGTILIGYIGVMVRVEEINLTAQLFFKKNNYRWVSTEGQYYTMRKFINVG